MDKLEVVNLHDIGVVQRRNKLGFALKTSGEIGIRLQIGVELLNGDEASQVGIKSLPDFALPTACQAFSQFVFAKASRLHTHACSCDSYLLISSLKLSRTS